MGYVGIVFIVIVCCALAVACVKTAPDGSGPVDASGTARDPGKLLSIGDAAPPFLAVDEAGNEVRLADFEGRKGVVLIFYPGNETPGCTAQLCAARDSWGVFEAANVAVLGVNPASAESHAAFRKNHRFPFPLIADGDGAVTRAYGARGPLGIVKRTVYGIDKSGAIVFARRGSPDSREILSAFKGD